jgi:hypothetical protein
MDEEHHVRQGAEGTKGPEGAGALAAASVPSTLARDARAIPQLVPLGTAATPAYTAARHRSCHRQHGRCTRLHASTWLFSSLNRR